MSPDQKPEWFEIADADNSASPRPVAKTLPALALLVTVAIFGVGTVFAQTQQESPASAVSSVTAAAAPSDQVVASTQPSTDAGVIRASSTPAAGSASMERTNPNTSIRINTVSTSESSEEPTAVPAPQAAPTQSEEPTAAPTPKAAPTKTEEPTAVPTPKAAPTKTEEPTPIKAPTIGVKPPKGGEHEGNEHKNSGDHEGEGEDD